MSASCCCARFHQCYRESKGVGKMKPASHARATTAEIQNQEKRDQRGWGAFGRLQEVMYGKSRDVGKKGGMVVCTTCKRRDRKQRLQVVTM